MVGDPGAGQTAEEIMAESLKTPARRVYCSMSGSCPCVQRSQAAGVFVIDTRRSLLHDHLSHIPSNRAAGTGSVCRHSICLR